MSPIYEYLCECSAVIEEVHPIDKAPRTIRCEVCDGTMKRVISATSFQLKGAGWCRDGYSSYVADAIKSGANIRGAE